MDEIHVKSDISYKGGKIYGSSLSPEDPIKTVFDIMVSSLHKKCSTIVRLLPCGSLSAEKIFPTITACVKDIERCGLFIDIISTDNYPFNVQLFKLFSPAGRLEPCVPNPFDISRPLFLTFDFVHILTDHLKFSNYWSRHRCWIEKSHLPLYFKATTLQDLKRPLEALEILEQLLEPRQFFVQFLIRKMYRKLANKYEAKLTPHSVFL